MLSFWSIHDGHMPSHDRLQAKCHSQRTASYSLLGIELLDDICKWDQKVIRLEGNNELNGESQTTDAHPEGTFVVDFFQESKISALEKRLLRSTRLARTYAKAIYTFTTVQAKGLGHR